MKWCAQLMTDMLDKRILHTSTFFRTVERYQQLGIFLINTVHKENHNGNKQQHAHNNQSKKSIDGMFLVLLLFLS